MLKFLTSTRFLYFYAVLAIALPNVALCLTEHMPLLACAANVVLPVAVYALLMALSAKVGRQVWCVFLLIFFAAFQMVLLYLYGRSVIAVDMFLNLVTTNPGEAMELLDNLVPAVAGVVVVYVPLLVLASVSWARHAREREAFLGRARRVSLWAAAAGLALVASAYVAYPRGADFEYRAEDHVYPVNVFYNLCLAARESYRTQHYANAVAHYRFGARSAHEADSAEVYVLVVGETARADNFQLYGYGRPTNPLLSQDSGLCVFRHALSQSNTTHKSVPMLLSAASATGHDRLYRERGIVAAFREAGFHTAFFSNQLPNHSFIDFFGEEAHDFVFVRNEAESGAADGDVAALTSDDRLLPYLRRALDAGHRKLFVVLHTYGSHFNYRDRYAQRYARFMPDTPTEAEAKNRPQLINAYDNTILQTDRLLHSVIAMLRERGCAAAMLYTSDHGENIFDDSRRRFLHASPVPSAYGIHVPLMVWTSEQYRRQYPDAVRGMESNRLKGVETSASVFPTMLSLAGISSPRVADVMPLSLADGRYKAPRRRHYLDDHNRAVTLRQVGMVPQDFEALAKWGISE